MERILVAWIGGIDIDEGLQGRTGPVHSTLEFKAFTQAHLLYNYAAKDKDASKYVSWLKKQPVATNTQLESYYVPLTSPQDFGEIYQAADKLLATIQKTNPAYPNEKFVDHLQNHSFTSMVDRGIVDKRHAIRKVGSRAAHEGRFKKGAPQWLFIDTKINCTYRTLFSN